MTEVEKLEALTSDNEGAEKAPFVLNGEELEVPLLKARHLAKTIKSLMPLKEELINGNLTKIYEDLENVINLVAIFFERTSDWAGDLSTKELYVAFNAVIEKNPDFFLEVVGHLVSTTK